MRSSAKLFVVRLVRGRNTAGQWTRRFVQERQLDVTPEVANAVYSRGVKVPRTAFFRVNHSADLTALKIEPDQILWITT